MLGHTMIALILITSSFIGVRTLEGKEEWLSASVNKPIRGIACLSILIGHTWRMPNCSLVPKWLFSLVISTGYLWVAYFFFMSGYGLMNNYMERVDYSNGFLRK